MTCINASPARCENSTPYILHLEDVMPVAFHIKYLSRENAPNAYPVIRAAYPSVSLDDWLAYYAWISQPAEARHFSAGVVSIENARGYIQGLFSYVTGYGLGRGSVLSVENFVALDTGDRAAAIRRLIGAMEDVAHKHGCVTIHTQIPEFWTTVTAEKYGVHAHLADAGHDREMVRFSKFLRPG
ncbi:MAG: hypothetical protein O3B08_15525 [Proteobacteria bacterium]|jgi:hypothetical protein|nr:hypothetical protein [Pseudomonadota bacterium]